MSFVRTLRLLVIMAAVALTGTACGGASEGDEEVVATPAADGEVDDDDSGAETPADDDDGGSSSEPVTLTFVSWAASGETTAANIEQVIADFEAAHPTIAIESVPQPVSEIVNQVITMSAGGNPPDVVQSQTLFTPTLHAAGLLEPLDDFAAGFLDQLQPASIELGTVEGQLFGLPWFVAPLGFHYNTALMEEVGLDPSSPPATIDELTEQIAVAREANPNIVGFNLDTSQRDIGLDYNWALMRSFGAEPILDGCANADTPEFTAYVEWLRTLIAEEHTLPGKLFGEFRDNAAAGDLLFAYDGSYFQGIVQGINPDITDEAFYDTWAVSALPAGDGGESFATSSDHHLTLLNTSEHKEEALVFMEYLVTEQSAIEQYLLPLGGLPAVIDVSPYPELDNPITQAFVEEVVPTITRPPWGENYAAAADAVMSNLQRVFSADADPSAIAGDIHAELVSVYGC